ncbi:MAG TPA: HAD-IA family hydrolase [Candidatus Dormibacteraeota bacterium]|nr:HAD-IA family hydrolase [Candidatus Dormibacteraeota bacterium]
MPEPGAPTRVLPPREYRVVLFDAGGTLLRPNPSQEEVTARVLREAGIAVDRTTLADAIGVANATLFSAHGRNAHRWSSESAIREVWQEYYELVLGRLGVPWDPALGRRVYDAFGVAESWALFDDALPTLEALRDRGVRIGIVSDWGTALLPILHAVGLSQHAGVAVVSAYAGVAKPERDVFVYALARIGAAADETLYVGDVYVADVLGARGAGIEPILIDRAGRYGFVDCVVVRSLLEIVPLLEAARAHARSIPRPHA